MTIHTLGIDIAKNTFQLHCKDKNGKMILKKQLSRRELTVYVGNLPLRTIEMEACVWSSVQ